MLPGGGASAAPRTVEESGRSGAACAAQRPAESSLEWGIGERSTGGAEEMGRGESEAEGKGANARGEGCRAVTPSGLSPTCGMDSAELS
jgi:hypothetical protein